MNVKMMITKIDWLSFTIPFPHEDIVPSHVMGNAVRDLVYDFDCHVYDVVFGGFEYEIKKGRPPYSLCYEREDHGVYIFCNPSLPHVLFEITGVGCDSITDGQDPLGFLAQVADRLTRIDVASDMLCDTRPLDFVTQRTEGRFKTHSEFVSGSGETCYVGSRTSNRYARVYRYNAPHDRAHLLRAEHVLKSEDAKATAHSILVSGFGAVVKALGVAFGWQHASWLPDEITQAELSVWRAERREGKTLFWLNGTVAKTLIRLSADGSIDPREWLNSNVLDKLYDLGVSNARFKDCTPL